MSVTSERVAAGLIDAKRPADVSKNPSAVDILAKNGKSFRFAGYFLDKESLQRAARLYSFCRYIDDLADKSDNPSQAAIQLQRIRRELHTGTSFNPAVVDFINLMREHDIAIDVISAFMDGIIDDTDNKPIVDETALLQYCYRVAGTVGLMMCDVLGVKDPIARHHAIDLGIGMQLTNIARDVEEDALAGRRYLPASWVGDLAPFTITCPNMVTRLRLQYGVKRLLFTAEEFYTSGEAGLPYLPPRARLAIFIASRVYNAIGTVLHNWNYVTWAGRAQVGISSKFAIGLGCIIKYFSNSRLQNVTTDHDTSLHQELRQLPCADTREHQL